MSPELALLSLTALTVGVVHTLLGPDHYLPFIAMARARGWSARRTLSITLACGLGHVAASLLVGALGILFGWSLAGLSRVDDARGSIAVWLLIGFGLAYAAWGLRSAARSRPHSHLHTHANGTLHSHGHTHRGEHAHVHERISSRRSLTPWVLFTIFVFGPCEALVPLLMVPAAGNDWWGIGFVALVFALATLATMSALVMAGHLGLASLALGPVERYSHALAGLALAACGLAMRLGL
jgi:ABC-type nickel/cobalt efflux system permease component RcnA